MAEIKKSDKPLEEFYQERERRIYDTINLKIPDRVPIALLLEYFPASYTRITCEEAYYDPDKWKRASRKTLQDFEPDAYLASSGINSGLTLEILDSKQMRWPGHGVSPYHSHQMLELEPMKEEEYDEILNDPSDFILRKLI